MILLFLFLLIPSLALSAGNETINLLPDSNKSSFRTESQNFWKNELPQVISKYFLGDFVVSGGLHTPVGACVSPTFSVEAFTNAGNHISDESTINYGAAPVGGNCLNDTCWVVGSSSAAATLPGSSYKKSGISNYYVNCVSPTEPTQPVDTVKLMKVTLSGGSISAVADLRRPASYSRSGVYRLDDPLYGGKCDGTANGGGTDNTPAWNIIVNNLKSHPGVIEIPSGFCTFNSKPDGIAYGITVRGEGENVSYLVRNYTEADVSRGFIDMDAGIVGAPNLGGGVERLTIWAPPGTSGGSGINIQSSATIAQGQVLIDWIRISGDGTYNYPIRVDGSLKITDASGVRFVVIRHAFLSRHTEVGLLLIGVNHGIITQVGIFSGEAGSVDLIVDGGTGGGVQTNDVTILCEFCPTVEIGKTRPTQAVMFNTTHTTTVTVSTNLSLFTAMGSIGSIVGTYNPAVPNNISFLGGGKIGAGVAGFTADGAQLETADGLTFPIVPIVSANSRTLDAYAFGTFTPRVLGQTTAGAGAYTAQNGFYTRIGRRVFIDIYIAWTSHTGTGNFLIDGLPFTVSGSSNYYSTFPVWSSNIPAGAGKQLMTKLNQAGFIEFYGYDPTLSVGGIAQLAIANTTGQIILSGSYRIEP